MKIIARPIGTEYGLDIKKARSATDIASINYDYHAGLRIIVATSPKSSFEDLSLEYLFQYPRGFRALHECDILRFWENEAFLSHHHLYEIIGGGWFEQEKQFPDAFVSSDNCKEWFVRTSNHCVNILCETAPLIRELPSNSSSIWKKE